MLERTNASAVSRSLREVLPETAYQAKDIGSGLIDVLCSTAYAARAMAHLDAKGYSYNSSVYSAGTRLIVNGRS